LDELLAMTDESRRADAHLEPDPAKREVIARALRERRATSARNTVVRPLRWWVPLTLALAMAACGGGGKRTDTYAEGSNAQAQCCEHLTGGERDRCLSEIVRVEPDAAQTSTNQATYACVVEHFVCDARTGRSTQQSAQAQYDCIEDQAR
jgi:hypothetical protein